jgi:hypothetical protein
VIAETAALRSEFVRARENENVSRAATDGISHVVEKVIDCWKGVSSY